MRRLRWIAPVAAMVLTIAGCDGDPTPAGTATPPTTSRTAGSTVTTAPPTSTSRPTVAPPVADPVDLRSVYTHPCATLTAAQQNHLGLRPRVKESVEGNVGQCQWAKRDANYDYYQYDLVLNHDFDLLAEAYQHSNDPMWTMFEPREVRGFPAVVESSSEPSGFCQVVVGLGGSQGIKIFGSQYVEPDPTLCDRLATAAEWIIDAARK
jgi:hypothetical protein